MTIDHQEIRKDLFPKLQTGLILLAAGESRRLEGGSKQLLEFRGKTLIQHAAEQSLASSANPVCVVLGAKSRIIKKEIEDLRIEVVINENWVGGMGSSIRSGLKHLLKIAPDLSAVILQLCDQPLITGEIIDLLIKTHEITGKEIVAAEYEETFGVPALFERILFAELLNLDDQAGAKSVVKRHKNESAFVRIPEAAFDIDTREDYEKLIGSKNIL